MEVSGVLIRLAEPHQTGQALKSSTMAPKSPCPNIRGSYILNAVEGQGPPIGTLYTMDDITNIVNSPSGYEEDVNAHKEELASITWVICAFINGRDKGAVPDGAGGAHSLPEPPIPGSVLVINGSTPRADKEQDYHDWYDQEHGEKLTLVPGWNAARRYRLAKSYGEAKTAKFYGFNYYDEHNGLGGPEWKAGVTEWTLRIRSNAAEPNIRRVWKIASTTE